MTNFDFIRRKFVDYLISDDIIKDNCLGQGLDPNAMVDEVSNKQLDLAYADCILYILRLPTSVSQGDFSMSSVDKEHYLAELRIIYNKYGMQEEIAILDKKPDITNAGEWY